MMLLFLIVLFTEPSGLVEQATLGGDELALPVDIAQDEESYWVLDIKLMEVINMNAGSEVLSRFGTKGQGPGEFNNPVAIRVADGFVWVYDSHAQQIMKFEKDGVLVSQHRVPRGSFAKFRDDRLVIHAPLGQHQFSLHDMGGEQLFHLGQGMNQNVRIDQVSSYMRRYDLTGNNLFWLSVGGGSMRWVDLNNEKQMEFPLAVNFDLYTKKSEVVMTGKNTFSFGGGVPVLGLLCYDDGFLILVDDENTEDVCFVFRLDGEGQIVWRHRFDKEFQKMWVLNNRLYLLDTYDATFSAFSIN